MRWDGVIVDKYREDCGTKLMCNEAGKILVPLEYVCVRFKLA